MLISSVNNRAFAYIYDEENHKRNYLTTCEEIVEFSKQGKEVRFCSDTISATRGSQHIQELVHYINNHYDIKIKR